jgi:hypothetical protein
MFHISKGQLDLSTETVDEIVRKIGEKELEDMTLRKVMKFAYFCKHPDHVKNPITALAWGNKIIDVHPGHFRLLAAYFSGQKFIDTIFLHTDDEVKDIATDLKPFDDAILLKQYGSDFWQITIGDQKTYFNDEGYINETNMYESVWNDIHERFGEIEWNLKRERLWTTDNGKSIDKYKKVRIYDPLHFYSSLFNLIR